MILASVLSGALARAEAEWERFAVAHPQSEGFFAGRRVKYVEQLGELLRQAADWPSPNTLSDWPVFAGTAQRNGIAPRIDDIGWEPIWRVALDSPGRYDGLTVRRWGAPEVRVAETDEQLCSYYPVIVGQHVLVLSEHRLRCVELATGQPVAWSGNEDGQIYPSAEWDRAEIDEPTWRGLHVPRYTLSVHNQVVYFLLSERPAGTAQGAPDTAARQRLVGIDLRTQGKLLFPPVAPPDSNWHFDGAPLVEGADLFVCLTEDAAVPAVHVGCLRGGRWRWVRRIGHGDPLATRADSGRTHHLLTLAGDMLYVSSDVGAVAALSKSEGHVQWITRYPRAAWTAGGLVARSWHVWRDLTPCLWHDGRLLVAPADYDGIFALDASSGALLWETEQPPGTLDVTHLLGVVDGCLVASGRRLWWLDVDTGRTAPDRIDNPFPRGASAPLTGFGRGVVAGSQVLWPAQGAEDQLLVLDASSGHRAHQPMSLTAFDVSAGNLALGRGVLLVAGPRIGRLPRV